MFVNEISDIHSCKSQFGIIEFSSEWTKLRPKWWLFENIVFIISNLHWNRNMKKLEIYFWHMTRLQLAVPLLSNDVIKKSSIYMTSPNKVNLLKKRVNRDSVTLLLAYLVRFLSLGAQITFILKLGKPPCKKNADFFNIVQAGEGGVCCKFCKIQRALWQHKLRHRKDV